MIAARVVKLLLSPLCRSVGARQALRDLSTELKIKAKHRRSCRRAKRYAGQTGLKLNVGCGPNKKPGWVNIDLFCRDSDLQLDVRERLPFADNSVELIYSEHLFEHLEFPRDTSLFLAESLRILAPGGTFSVGVPDTEWPLQAYVNDEKEYFEMSRRLWHPEWCDTRMHQINYHFRQIREHKYAWDFETLAKVLREAGFAEAVRRDFDESLDCEARKTGTLYVDAIKRAASPGEVVSKAA